MQVNQWRWIRRNMFDSVVLCRSRKAIWTGERVQAKQRKLLQRASLQQIASGGNATLKGVGQLEE